MYKGRESDSTCGHVFISSLSVSLSLSLSLFLDKVTWAWLFTSCAMVLVPRSLTERESTVFTLPLNLASIGSWHISSLVGHPLWVSGSCDHHHWSCDYGQLSFITSYVTRGNVCIILHVDHSEHSLSFDDHVTFIWCNDYTYPAVYWLPGHSGAYPSHARCNKGCKEVRNAQKTRYVTKLLVNTYTCMNLYMY